MAYLKNNGKTIVIDGLCLVAGCGRKITDPKQRPPLTCDVHLEQMRKSSLWMKPLIKEMHQNEKPYEPNPGGC
jgi:hypothetical protein